MRNCLTAMHVCLALSASYQALCEFIDNSIQATLRNNEKDLKRTINLHFFLKEVCFPNKRMLFPRETHLYVEGLFSSFPCQTPSLVTVHFPMGASHIINPFTSKLKKYTLNLLKRNISEVVIMF